jgi:hypothetical protein
MSDFILCYLLTGATAIALAWTPLRRVDWLDGLRVGVVAAWVLMGLAVAALHA